MSITAGSPILASDFVSTSGGGTDSGKGIKLNASGQIDKSFVAGGFGGTGADGALSITSGTTTIDLAGAAVFTKNYTSISITGTGKLAFSNPHANGTIIILKSQGNVTITTSGSPAIDLTNLGSTAGVGATSSISSGSDAVDATSNCWKVGGGIGGIGTGGGAPAAALGGTSYGAGARYVYNKVLNLACGAGGGGGGKGNSGSASAGGGGASLISSGSTASSGINQNSSGGNGGRGAGALYIECGGAYNCTATISAAGTAGTASASAGGGGGGGGTIIVLYTTLTANSGTYTVSGGTGGTGSVAGGNGADGYSYVGANTMYA